MKLTINQILEQAISAHREEKFEEAEGFYRAILKIDPKNSNANHNLGSLKVSINKPQEALQLFKIAIETHPKIVEFRFSYATTLLSENQLDEAETSFKKIIKLKPDHAEAYNNLGIIFHKLKRNEEAEKCFKTAIEFKPNYGEAHNNLGVIFQYHQKFEETVASFKKAISLNIETAKIYYNLAGALHNLNRLEESEVNYKKAIELKPDYIEAYSNLGNLLKDRGKLEEAEISLNKAIEIKPDYKLALLNKGMILFDKGKFEVSLKYFDLCDNFDSRSYSLSCLYNLGRIKDIYKRIKINSELDEKNLSVAAFSSFISKKEKKNTAHKFCNNPIDFINISNLSSHLKNSNLFINEVIEELKTIETIWEDKTTKNGFHSVNRIDIFENPSEKLKNLKSIIADEIDIYYSKFKNEDCSYIKKWPAQKNLIAWHVILKKQGYQTKHIHAGGWLSGVIYLKVTPHLEKNEGAIEFSLNGERYFDKNLPKIIHQPKEGDMVLFPSTLHHNTIPFTSTEDRITIAFDLIPSQKIII